MLDYPPCSMSLEIYFSPNPTMAAPFRLPFLQHLPPLPHLTNRRGCEGCATASPTSGTSLGNGDRRRGGRAACANAAFSNCLQDNAIWLWTAGGLDAEDSIWSGHCCCGACASCDGSKGACRCNSLPEARVEKTGQSGVGFFSLSTLSMMIRIDGGVGGEFGQNLDCC